MDEAHELVNLTLCNAVTCTLDKPLLKIDENEVVGNVHVKEEITESSIDSMAGNGHHIKLEEVDIKDELIVTHASSASPSQKVSKYGAEDKSTFWENMIIDGKIFHSCSFCAYKTARKHNIVNHIATHTGEKPYSCTICKYRAAQKGYLVKHMKIHTKSHLCSICEYKSTEKGKLVMHMRTHTGEQPFSCVICKYKSGKERNLIQHMRVHTCEKRYSCSVCGYKVAAKHSLTRHMWTHTYR